VAPRGAHTPLTHAVPCRVTSLSRGRTAAPARRVQGQEGHPAGRTGRIHARLQQGARARARSHAPRRHTRYLAHARALSPSRRRTCRPTSRTTTC
jgi:hypothetical protein